MNADTILIGKQGQIVSQSRNLRGLLDYARRHPVVWIETQPLTWVSRDGRPLWPAGARLYLRFADGAEAMTYFSSYAVLQDWIKARRTWKPSAVWIDMDQTIWRQS